MKSLSDIVQAIGSSPLTLNLSPGLGPLCDIRGVSTAEPRFYVLRVKCTCVNPECKCGGKPHVEMISKEGVPAELENYALEGAVCLECGGV